MASCLEQPLSRQGILQEASLKSAVKGGRKTIPANFVEIIDTLVDKVASYKGVVLSSLPSKPEGAKVLLLIAPPMRCVDFRRLAVGNVYCAQCSTIMLDKQVLDGSICCCRGFLPSCHVLHSLQELCRCPSYRSRPLQRSSAGSFRAASERRPGFSDVGGWAGGESGLCGSRSCSCNASRERGTIWLYAMHRLGVAHTFTWSGVALVQECGGNILMG